MSFRLLRNSSLTRNVSFSRNLVRISLNQTRGFRLVSQSNGFRSIPSVVAPRVLHGVQRHYTVLTSNIAKLYKYDEIKDLSESEHPDQILVDVREPDEFADGSIPTAINIPYKSSPGALDLPEEEFQELFGFEKPSKEKELVFYCLGGVRSSAAEELANCFGYQKRGNYVGSYEDWVSNETKEEPEAKL